MKKVCAMAGTIFNPEKPKQSIKELKEAGIQGILFDFGLIAPTPHLHAKQLRRNRPSFLPDRANITCKV